MSIIKIDTVNVAVAWKPSISLFTMARCKDNNRSPKGNTWSAIPVALLCMIVNWSERKQGNGPKGQNSGLRGPRADKQTDGRTDEQTNKQTDERKSPCVLQDFVPFGAAALTLIPIFNHAK